MKYFLKKSFSVILSNKYQTYFQKLLHTGISRFVKNIDTNNIHPTNNIRNQFKYYIVGPILKNSKHLKKLGSSLVRLILLIDSPLIKYCAVNVCRLYFLDINLSDL